MADAQAGNEVTVPEERKTVANAGAHDVSALLKRLLPSVPSSQSGDVSSGSASNVDTDDKFAAKPLPLEIGPIDAAVILQTANTLYESKYSAPMTAAESREDPAYLRTTASRINAVAAKEYTMLTLAANDTLNKHLAGSLNMSVSKGKREDPFRKPSPSAVQSTVDELPPSNYEANGPLTTSFKSNAKKSFASKSPAVSKSDMAKADVYSLARLEAPMNYLPNPRSTKTQVTLKHGSVKKPTSGSRLLESVFLSNPCECCFKHYEVGDEFLITVDLRNVSTLSHRVRFVPPKNPMFSVMRGKFPDSTGLVAPGMSCSFMLSFRPTTVDPVDDFVTVVVENEKFEYPVSADRIPPCLLLPYSVSFPPIAFGELKKLQFEVENEGSRGAFRLSTDNPEFVVSPEELTLQPSEKASVTISFSADTEGLHSTVLHVEADTKHQWTVPVSAEVVYPSFQVATIGDRAVGADLQRVVLPFPPTVLHSLHTEVIVLKNPAKVPVRYRWDICDPSSPATASVFRELAVYPAAGTIAAGSNAECVIKYCPEIVAATHRVVVLVLEQVPYPCANDHPLLPFLSCQPNFRGDLPVPAGSKMLFDRMHFFAETRFLPISPDWDNGALAACMEENAFTNIDVDVFRMDLYLDGREGSVTLDPLAMIIPGSLFVGKTYQRYVVLTNPMDAACDFEWSVNGTEESSISVSISCMRGSLEPGVQQSFTVEISPHARGTFEFSLSCTFSIASPVSLPISGNATGSCVTLSEPCIDFGVVETGSTVTTPLTVTNNSSVPTTFLLALKSDQLTDQLLSASLTAVMKDAVLCDAAKNGSSPADSSVVFIPQSGVLKPHASQVVSVFFRPQSRVVLDDFVCCHVRHVDVPQMVSMRGVSEGPFVSVDRRQFDVGVMYEDVPVSVTFELRNHSGVYAPYKWEATDTDDCVTICTPESGVLPPASTVAVECTVVARKSGILDIVVPCVVDGMQKLVGIGFTAEVRGLSVQCTVDSDEPDTLLMRPRELQKGDETVSPDMMLDFGTACPLMHKLVKTVTLKNLSACRTRYSVSVEHYPASALASSSTTMSKTHTQSLRRKDAVAASGVSWADNLELVEPSHRSLGISHRQASSSSMSSRTSSVSGAYLHAGSGSNSAQSPPLTASMSKAKGVTDEYESRAGFTSANGQEMLMRKAEKQAEDSWISECLSEGTGCAFALSAAGGRLEQWEEVSFDVVAIANLPGYYEDVLTIMVHGLPTLKIAMKFGVVGSPLTFVGNAPCLVVPTFPSPDLPAVLSFPRVAEGTGIAKQTIRVRNQSACSVYGSFKVCCMRSRDVAVSLQPSGAGKMRVCLAKNSEPHNEDLPFEIKIINPGPRGTDRSCIFHPGEIKQIQVTFNGRCPSDCALQGQLVVETKFVLEGGAAKHVPAEPVSQLDSRVEDLIVSLVGGVIQPALDTDLKGALRFFAGCPLTAGADSGSKLIRPVVLSNRLSVPVSFRLSIEEGPGNVVSGLFALQNVHSSEELHTIAPQSCLDLGVSFSPVPFVESVTTESQLSYAGTIAIDFVGGRRQTIPLEANVQFARLSVDHDTLDFSKVSRPVTLMISIANESIATARWSLRHSTAQAATDTTDSPEVFSFSVTSGTIGPRSSYVQRQQLAVTFTPQRGSFQSSFDVICENGGRGCSFTLKGQGNFAEISV